MAHFTLRQLKYFTTVVETKSIAEASRQLHIAQPSISTAVKNLEDSFGIQLFIRHHAQGVSLTSSGKRFYYKARELLRQSWAFEQNAMADNDVVAGKISVGCFETAAPVFLPQMMRGFQRRHPGIEVQIHDGEQNELVQGLHSGRFDLAILYRHDLDDGIATERLNAPSKPYALLPIGHPLALRSSVTLDELSREPMILLDVVPSRDYFVNIFREKGLMPKIAYSSPSIEMVRCMVGQGFGFSLLVTRPFTPITYDGKQVAMVEVQGEITGSQLVLASLRHNPMTKPAQLFADYCKEQLLMPGEMDIPPGKVA